MCCVSLHKVHPASGSHSCKVNSRWQTLFKILFWLKKKILKIRHWNSEKCRLMHMIIEWFHTRVNVHWIRNVISLNWWSASVRLSPVKQAECQVFAKKGRGGKIKVLGKGTAETGTDGAKKRPQTNMWTHIKSIFEKKQ